MNLEKLIVKRLLTKSLLCVHNVNVLRKNSNILQKGLALSLSKGFTLIELLVVIGILAVLLAITLIAINPAKQFSQANDTQRSSNVNAILNAVDQYAADNKGNLPAGIDNTVRNIDSTGGVATVNLCATLVTKYLADLPVDPKTGTKAPAGSNCLDVGATYDSRYTIVSGADNRVTVSAPDTEISTPDISVTR